eukprot:COSAG01_NODE_1881_length_8990_cov_36.296142_3_plen_59_part_00
MDGNGSILTEIYLCHACSYQEIEDGNARPGGAQPVFSSGGWRATSVKSRRLRLHLALA